LSKGSPPEAIERPNDNSVTELKIIKAMLTDIQFWIPMLVLACGIVLLVILH
jgi:hypothetical protein